MCQAIIAMIARIGLVPLAHDMQRIVAATSLVLNRLARKSDEKGHLLVLALAYKISAIVYSSAVITVRYPPTVRPQHWLTDNISRKLRVLTSSGEPEHLSDFETSEALACTSCWQTASTHAVNSKQWNIFPANG